MRKKKPTRRQTFKFHAKVAKRLRWLRERKAMSQGDLALELGVNRGTIIRWETLAFEPLASQRRAYANALGIPVARLGAMFFTARS